MTINQSPKKGGLVLLILFCVCLWPIWGQSNQGIAKKIQIKPGFQIIYQQDSSSKRTVIKIAVKGGKKSDPKGQEGLNYLTTRLLLEIQSRSKLMELMTIGSTFSWDVLGDLSVISIKTLTGHFDKTMNLFFENFSKPLFSSLRMNLIKDSMEFKQEWEQNEPINLMFLTHNNTFFKNSPYSGSVCGDEQSLKTIKIKDIKKCYHQLFTVANIFLAITTDLDETTVKEFFTSHADQFHDGPAVSIPSIKTNPEPEKHIFHEKDKQQTLISFAFLLPSLNRKNYTIFLLLEDFLGSGIGSKLWQLRSKYQLTYGSNANVTVFKDAAILGVNFKTDNQKKEAAYKNFDALMSNLHHQGLNEEELNTAKTHTISSFYQKIETKEQRAFYMAFFEAIGLGYQFINQIPELIHKISLTELNEFIKNFLDPQKRIQVIIGPEDLKK